MKKLFLIITLFLAVGCASTQKTDPNYLAYLKEIKAWRTMERKPLLKLEVDPNGLIRNVEVNLPPDRIEVKPYEPKIHPGWHLAGTVVKAGATVVGVGLVADMLSDIANVAGHNNYYQDSFNSVGRDYNHLHDIQVYDKATFAPTWDYSTVLNDSYNTDIKDSFNYDSYNSYDVGGDGNTLQ